MAEPTIEERSGAASVHVALPSDLTAARTARSAARDVVQRWRLAGVLEPLQLVVSELVGNAVRHGRPPVEMLLRRAGRGVRVDVHDESPAPDLPRASTLSAPDAESGRGLYLVDAVSADAGVEQIAGDGKVTWARIEPES
jgi:anti-sigma regulatory factor (Ser/Thr protein kinase)